MFALKAMTTSRAMFQVTRVRPNLATFSTTTATTPFATGTTHPTQPGTNKGFLAKLRDQYSYSGQKKRYILGERLFRAAQRRANDPIWYGPGRIGREFRPRHAILTMHIWFMHKRLIKDKVDPHFALLVQEELFDLLWLDTTQRIRAQGVNELTVNKHLKDVQEYTFLHLTHYDHVYSDYKFEDPERYIELSGLVWIHLLLRDEIVHDDHLKRLVAYIDAQYENIMEHLPDEYFWEGRIGWVNIPNFDGMKDIRGDPLPPNPIHPDDILPEGWYSDFNNAGKMYFWNEKQGTSQWKRPTQLTSPS